LASQAHREAWLEVNLGALERNAQHLKRLLAPHQQAMAVVKADAYGHGAVAVAKVLQACGYTSLGVANVDEALQLRQGGITLPLLVLGATSSPWAFALAAQAGVQLTVFNATHLQALAQLPSLKAPPLQVQVKVDTGMHRLGVAPQEALALVQACRALPGVEVTGLYTHLACADEGPEATLRQWQRFEAVLEAVAATPQGLPRWVHGANSWGALHPQPTACNVVRFGIGLFGYELPSDVLPQQQPLEPLMGLKARVTHLHPVAAGEGISYGHSVVAQAPMVVATVPVGYADGVPRGLSNRLWAQCHGVRVPQVGRITMDQLMLDVTAVPQLQVGEVMTLLGEEAKYPQCPPLTLSPWAQALETIPYELLCGLRVRLPKVYTR
jgi:alanine racemase